MYTPIVTWLCIVLLLAVIVVIKVAIAMHHSRSKKIRMFDSGNEREMLFVPGDCLKIDERDYDDTDNM